MGRRALGKVDPELPLARHFYALEDWEPGRQILDVFPVEQPLEIEVGCGKGLFLRNAALLNPARNFLGIEIAHKYARFAAAKLAKLDLPNAAMFHGDGEKLLRDHVLDGTLDGVHVYFPDPWWKARHRKRRVMNESFVFRVADVLKPNGALHFWTDVQEYYEVTLELLKKVGPLEGPFDVIEKPPEHDLDYRTHYERRMRQGGRSIFRALYRKVA